MVDVDFAALRQVGVCRPHVFRGRAGSTGSQGFRGATELTGRVYSQTGAKTSELGGTAEPMKVQSFRTDLKLRLPARKSTSKQPGKAFFPLSTGPNHQSSEPTVPFTVWHSEGRDQRRERQPKPRIP